MYFDDAWWQRCEQQRPDRNVAVRVAVRHDGCLLHGYVDGSPYLRVPIDCQIRVEHDYNDNEKALRETQTLRALAVVRFGHRPPARPPATNTQTHRQDRLQYTAPLASAQCNDNDWQRFSLTLLRPKGLIAEQGCVSAAVKRFNLKGKGKAAYTWYSAYP